MYIEPWHADVMEVLELKKNHGKDELRARCVRLAACYVHATFNYVPEPFDRPVFLRHGE